MGPEEGAAHKEEQIKDQRTLQPPAVNYCLGGSSTLLLVGRLAEIWEWGNRSLFTCFSDFHSEIEGVGSEFVSGGGGGGCQ